MTVFVFCPEIAIGWNKFRIGPCGYHSGLWLFSRYCPHLHIQLPYYKTPTFIEMVGTLRKQTAQSPPGVVCDCQLIIQHAWALTLFLHPPVLPLRDTKPVQILFPPNPIYLQVLWQLYAIQKVSKTPDHPSCAPKIFPMATSPIPWVLRAEGSSLQSGTSYPGRLLWG